jgi:hypothetical protein
MIGLELFNGDAWLGAHHEIAVVTLAMIAYWIAQSNIAQLVYHNGMIPIRGSCRFLFED